MINWKVRIKNPQFWMSFVSSVLLLVQLVLELFGVKVDFGDIGNKLKAIINAVFVVLATLGIVNDPTTNGFNDSIRAMSYEEPYKDIIEED